MIVGIDPFDAADAMGIQENILARRFKFTRSFPEDAKSLVKHLIVTNVTKRYGDLVNGPNDVKEHRWFADIDWNDIVNKTVHAPHFPKVVKDLGNSNFVFDTKDAEKINESNDPFANW